MEAPWMFCTLTISSVSFLIILYWYYVGTANMNFVATVSPVSRGRQPSPAEQPPQTSQSSHRSDSDTFFYQFLESRTCDLKDPSTVDPRQRTERAEERYIPRQEWKVHQTPVAPELLERQDFFVVVCKMANFKGGRILKVRPNVDVFLQPLQWPFQTIRKKRLQMIHEVCANESIRFPFKTRSFEDIPNEELENLIVDDRHGIVYCFVPKVACTNWKRIMIVLTESLVQNGVPQRDPMAIPTSLTYNPAFHLTLMKFPKRYGKHSRHLMKVKLRKYTKFLFVRDPFVRIISAFRDKFVKANDYYYNYGKLFMRLYGNQQNPPENVYESIKMGIRPTFHQFIQFLIDPKTEKPFDGHWRQVHKLCHPCQIQYDFVGHLETLDEDAEHLLRLLRVDNVVEFPKAGDRNVSESSWVPDWFRGIPVDQLRKLYKLFESDFRLFGYPRPDSILDD